MRISGFPKVRVYTVVMTDRRYSVNIGIKHDFSCINIRQVPWEVLKTGAGGRMPRFLTPPKGPGEC